MIRKSNLWGSLVGSSHARYALGLAGFGLVLLGSRVSAAQTWQGNREVPSVSEIVAIDASGEDGWQYGAEDVDGQGGFPEAEQQIDFRTAYATTDASRFYFRMYAVSTERVSPEVVAFVFINADANAATGGAAGPLFETRFGTDNSPGGYEYVVGVSGDESVNVWQWDAATGRFVGMPPAQISGRVEGIRGQEDDPLRAGVRNHGYVQASVDLALVGLNSACGATLYFRSVQNQTGLGPGDLDVGAAGPCRATATGGVPEVVNPTTVNPTFQCIVNADCPAGGVCVNNTCWFPAFCVVTADCPSGQECVDGVCVVPGGTVQCVSNAECAPLVCLNGLCVGCYVAGAECPPGQLCAADGRCFVPTTGVVGAQCFTGAQCASGICVNGQCVDCNTYPNLCPVGQVCAPNGICVIPALTGAQCTSNIQCLSGLCVNGFCVDCRSPGAACPAGQVCTADGRCVSQVGAQCIYDSQCITGVCLDGRCVDCTTAPNLCPAGQICATDGRCYVVAGTGGTGGILGTAGTGGLLRPGEKIEGGACNCTVVGQKRDWLLGLGLGALAVLGLRRRARNTAARR